MDDKVTLNDTVALMRETLAGAGNDIASLVAAFVQGIADVVERHPWLPSLWVREVLCEGGALRELMVREIAPQLPQMLALRFAAAQKQGALNPGLDPRLLVVSLVGLTMFPAAGAPIWRQVFDATDLDADALREHCRKTLAAYKVPKQVRFLDTPDAYFEVIDERVPNHGEDVARLARNKILIDADLETKQRKLLQIFTTNAIGPIFFEIIQRKGNEGFGEGNFQALFESIERDQIKRGVL